MNMNMELGWPDPCFCLFPSDRKWICQLQTWGEGCTNHQLIIVNISQRGWYHRHYHHHAVRDHYWSSKGYDVSQICGFSEKVFQDLSPLSSGWAASHFLHLRHNSPQKTDSRYTHQRDCFPQSICIQFRLQNGRSWRSQRREPHVVGWFVSSTDIG